MRTATTRIRNEYRFKRSLTPAEGQLLRTMIGWRRGSRVGCDKSGAVVACVAHPDDVAEFQKELRKQQNGKPLQVEVKPEAKP